MAPINLSEARGKAPTAVEIYDTTLRDGAQLEGISLTVDDKLRIAEQLDYLGVHFIEGGWPGANPKDNEFFERAKSELNLTTSTFVAFGSTRRVGVSVEDDVTLGALLGAETEAVCIVGKTWDYHVTEALRTTLDEGVAMVAESIAFLKAHNKFVLFDAEHFFDGYKNNPEFAMRVISAAQDAGVDRVVLCDTNGGSLPFEVRQIVDEVTNATSVGIGVHLHDDTGCGVANALAGVRGGAMQVQGTINGYGERTGNCNLNPIIANLSLKMGIETIPADRLERLTPVANHVAELVNFVPDPQQPYVGASAFAHKAGLHTSALSRRQDAYEHVVPTLVGNGSRFPVSEMAGKASIKLRAQELGIDLDDQALGEVIDALKHLEHDGYHFEVADASFELLMRGASGWVQPFFAIESFRTSVEHRADDTARAWNDVAIDVETEATVKLMVGSERIIAAGEGNGPVDALHSALGNAISSYYPAFEEIHLTDYKVRVLNSTEATGATTRVLIDSSDGKSVWTTIGVSTNIIEASWQALADAVVYGLLKAGSVPVLA